MGAKWRALGPTELAIWTVLCFATVVVCTAGESQPGYVGCFNIESQTGTEVIRVSRAMDAGALCQRKCAGRGASYFGLRDYFDVAGTVCGCFNSLTEFTLEVLGGEPTEEKYCEHLCPLSAFNCAYGHVDGASVKNFAVYAVDANAHSILYRELTRIVQDARRQVIGLNPADAQITLNLAYEAIRNLDIPPVSFDPTVLIGTSFGNLVDVTTIRTSNVNLPSSVIIQAAAVTGHSGSFYQDCVSLLSGDGFSILSGGFKSTDDFMAYKANLFGFDHAGPMTSSRSGGAAFAAEFTDLYDSTLSGTRTISVGAYWETIPDFANSAASILAECLNDADWYSADFISALASLPSTGPVTSDVNDLLYPAYHDFFASFGTHQVRQIVRGLNIQVLRTDVADNVMMTGDDYFAIQPSRSFSEMLGHAAKAGFDALAGGDGGLFDVLDDHATAEKRTKILVSGGLTTLAAHLAHDFDDRRGSPLTFNKLLDSSMNSADANIASVYVAPISVLASSLFGSPDSPVFPTNGSQILENLDSALLRYAREAAFKKYCKPENWDQESYTCVKTAVSTMAGLPVHITIGDGRRTSHVPLFSFLSRAQTNAGLFSLCGSELYGSQVMSTIRNKQSCNLGGSEPPSDIHADPPKYYGTQWSFVVSGLADYPGAFHVPPSGSSRLNGNIDINEPHCILTAADFSGNVTVRFEPYDPSDCLFVHIVENPQLALRIGIPVPDEEIVQYLVVDPSTGMLVARDGDGTFPPKDSTVNFRFERVRSGDKTWGAKQWWSSAPVCNADCHLCNIANANGVMERCNALVKSPSQAGYRDQSDCVWGSKALCEVAPNWLDFGYTY